jgi:hypothetical protein
LNRFCSQGICACPQAAEKHSSGCTWRIRLARCIEAACGNFFDNGPQCRQIQRRVSRSQHPKNFKQAGTVMPNHKAAASL